jgi:hypothetical protein
MTPDELAAHRYKRRLRDERRWARMTPEEREADLEKRRRQQRERYYRNPELYRKKQRDRAAAEREAIRNDPLYRAYYLEVEDRKNERRGRHVKALSDALAAIEASRIDEATSIIKATLSEIYAQRCKYPRMRDEQSK